MDFIKSLIDIKFHKDFSFINSCQGLINKGKRVLILISNIIKFLVINIKL